MFFDDLKLGMWVKIAPAVIEKQKMLEFAHTYDNIPLHTDEAYAKVSPFGQLIAPGVMSFMSVWARYLEVDFFGEQLLAGKSTQKMCSMAERKSQILLSGMPETDWWRSPLKPTTRRASMF